MSSDLAAFLRARLDEDEAVAKAAEGRPEFDGTGIVIQHNQGGDRSVVMPSHVAIHIGRHDPARVLREVEAGRKLLAALDAAQREQPVPGSLRDDPYDPAVSFSAGEYAGLLAAVRIRAAVYRDHADYRPEWKP